MNDTADLSTGWDRDSHQGVTPDPECEAESKDPEHDTDCPRALERTPLFPERALRAVTAAASKDAWPDAVR